MKQRSSHILYNYWNEVRGTRLAPRRFEIEPSHISSILAETFILERVDAHTYTFRLAGTRICEQFGMEFRGRNFIDLAGEADRDAMEFVFANITNQGAVGLFEIEARDRENKPVHFEALALPLLHGNQGVTRYVGALSAIDSPPWLGHQPLKPHALTMHTLMWPDGRPHAVFERTNHQAPFAPEFANARVVRFNRRHFRILDGGKSAGGGK